jgi:hypothetical protein
MKRMLLNLFLAFGTVCTYGLHAQSYEMVVKVPFAFHLDKTDFTAGEYHIARTGTCSAQFIGNRSGHKAAIASGSSALENKGTPRLVFHRYGDDYFLAEIWNTQGTGNKLPPSKRERLASEQNIAGMQVETVELVASLQ